MRATSQFFLATQRAAGAALLWWRFTYGTLSLWPFLYILQSLEDNAPQSPEILEV
jgi:hypothetical protein